MLLLNTIPLSGASIGEHFITLTCHRCHTIERFVKVFWHFFRAAREVNVRFNVYCSCFFFIIVAIYGNCCGLYNCLWFGTWLVWQKLVHFVEESRFLLWCGISRLGALVFIASIGAYQSVNSCLAAVIVSVFICAAISSHMGFFLVHDFSWSWVFSSPHFSSNRRVSLCSQTLPRVLVSAAILTVLSNTTVKLPREVVLLNTILDVFC